MSLIHFSAIFFNLLSIISLAYSDLVFTPSRVIVNPRQGKTVVDVILDKKPRGTVDVYYNLENTNFDRCSLTFNETTWDKPQKLTMSAQQLFAQNDTTLELSAQFKTVSCDDESYNNVDASLPVTRSPGQVGTCEALSLPQYKVTRLSIIVV